MMTLYRRLHDTTEDGVRGVLACGPILLHSIENKSTPRMLPEGTYDLELSMMRDGKRRAIRILPDGHHAQNFSAECWWSLSRGRIYLHVANTGHELDGCIAPGLYRGEEGVAESRRALESLFAWFGGFEQGKRVGKLQVINHG